MLTNIRGLVDRLELAPTRGVMPLFEAISNAMDAIEENTGTRGRRCSDKAFGVGRFGSAGGR